MPMELPAAIAGYVASANAHDAAACARYFTEDAIVHDEGHERHGIAAIREWKEEVSRKYRPIISALDVARANEKIIMTARVAGDFQGSPIDLHFAFTLRENKIARLEITP
jgi:ketosteroid isomerase-like protein